MSEEMQERGAVALLDSLFKAIMTCPPPIIENVPFAEFEIYTIYLRYLVVMLGCGLWPEVKKFVINNPRCALEKFVGMKIPDDAIIELDKNDRYWPTVLFEKKEDQWSLCRNDYEQYDESARLIKHLRKINNEVKIVEIVKTTENTSAKKADDSGTKTTENTPAKKARDSDTISVENFNGMINVKIEPAGDEYKMKTQVVDIGVPGKKKEYDKTIIKLPFFIPDADLLVRYKFGVAPQDDTDAEIILTCC
ncbi:MAG: hypothetical protein MUF15_06805 [Acidobacteria bacterium]|jgi:hypothetical protein|nr:hypothetical protein [Acidobacteriota bacterium]